MMPLLLSRNPRASRSRRRKGRDIGEVVRRFSSRGSGNLADRLGRGPWGAASLKKTVAPESFGGWMIWLSTVRVGGPRSSPWRRAGFSPLRPPDPSGSR